MSNIFLSGCLHLGHNNLITRGVRNFKNCEEHDETIIKNFNSVIRKGDLLYILGDCVWDGDFSIYKRMNGTKIVVKGNHDKKEHLQRAKSAGYIANWHYYKGFMHKGNYIFMIHFPMLSWDRSFHGSFCAHSHCHGSLETTKGRQMDVGVDANNFTPVLLDDFIAKLIDRDNRYFYDTETGKDLVICETGCSY